MDTKIASQLFATYSDEKFSNLAIQIFKKQAINNVIYKSYLDYLKVDPNTVQHLNQIPFLPIQFFKNEKILSSSDKIEAIFLSSGTSGTKQSKHYITDLNIYKQSFIQGFEGFYGNIEDYTVLALLPNYLEQKGSSLILMVDHFIRKSKSHDSGFYLKNLDDLALKLNDLDQKNQKILLIGVSFALLDLIEYRRFRLKNTIIMETGGMKGRRKEMIREELHQLLSNGFGVDKIHSEYGMTELLSQAYSDGEGFFKTPSWMKVMVRDSEDPLTLLSHNQAGGLNIIDLANINSCSFIATQDLGKTYKNGTFEIIGRFDHSEIRGCNLLVV